MFVLSSNQDSDIGDLERYVCLGGGGGIVFHTTYRQFFFCLFAAVTFLVRSQRWGRHR